MEKEKNNENFGGGLVGHLLPVVELATERYGIDETFKMVMSKKDVVGEFSLDMYYNDLRGDAGEGYTVLLTYWPSGKKKHFRRESFVAALAECVLWLDVYHGTNLTGFMEKGR